jgi:hypothetical protein
MRDEDLRMKEWVKQYAEGVNRLRALGPEFVFDMTMYCFAALMKEVNDQCPETSKVVAAAFRHFGNALHFLEPYMKPGEEDEEGQDGELAGQDEGGDGGGAAEGVPKPPVKTALVYPKGVTSGRDLQKEVQDLDQKEAEQAEERCQK